MALEPKLRTVNKVAPPYEINKFPQPFVQAFGEELAYMLATKTPMSIEGTEWEGVFARCIGAEWKPSNVGLDDVVLGNCCWSAKTVFGSKNLASQGEVRLISGRCSPVYSYDSDGVSPSSDPAVIGELVLGIWNERVSSIRAIYKFARTVVLVKSRAFDEYLVFETDTIRYDPEMHVFSWNARGNLEGHDKRTGRHAFTWQPHGSQLTIIESIPRDRMHIRIRVPEQLKREQVLGAIGFDESWTTVVNAND